MGKPVGRLGDPHTGHSCFPPTKSIVASSNVIVNKKGALRVGDQYAPHCCPKQGCHPPVQASGSGSVIVNGKPVARIGDKTGCGASLMVGSSNVIAG